MRAIRALPLMLLLVPTAAAEAAPTVVPTGPVAEPRHAPLVADPLQEDVLTFVDVGRVWLELRGDHALVIVEVRQLDEVFLAHAGSWTGEIDVYDWETRSRLSGDWRLERRDGASTFTFRTFEGWSPRETEGAFRVSTGSPGYVAMAFPREAWARDDVGFFRTIDVHLDAFHKGTFAQDAAYFNRENPAVPGPGVGASLVAIVGAVGVAFVLRRKA